MHETTLLRLLVGVALMKILLVNATVRVASAKHFLHRSSEIPGWGTPAWGGRTFSDSSAALNGWDTAVPWASWTDALGEVDAPGNWPNSVIGAAPVAPSGGSDAYEGVEASVGMRPDIVPRDLHPPTFPEEHVPEAYPDVNEPLVPIGDRVIVAKPDRLRRGAFPESEFSPIGNNYPLAAPANRMPADKPWPVANADEVTKEFARALYHEYGRTLVLRDAEATQYYFKYVDVNADGVISIQEFMDEVVHHQGKTTEEARRLWDWARYNSRSSLDSPLNVQEFGRLVRSGFDVTMDVGRDDVTSVLSSGDEGVNRGFWGSGAACPKGHFASGAKLKRDNVTSEVANRRSHDNTGLNALSLRCDSVKDITSAEGPDGVWTSWDECPTGQVIYGFRMRTMPLLEGRDLSGVNDMEFSCRARPNSDHRLSINNAISAGIPKELRFVGGPTEGGWSRHFYCPNFNTAICGVQVRLMSDQDEGDDIGVTDVRMYCCGMVESCSKVCKGVTRKAPTVECTACNEALNALSSS